MQLADFNYDLPLERIAQRPLSLEPGSRLERRIAFVDQPHGEEHLAAEQRGPKLDVGVVARDAP